MHGHGRSLVAYYLGNWMWTHLHWWTLLVCAGIIIISTALRVWGENLTEVEAAPPLIRGCTRAGRATLCF